VIGTIRKTIVDWPPEDLVADTSFPFGQDQLERKILQEDDGQYQLRRTVRANTGRGIGTLNLTLSTLLHLSNLLAMRQAMGPIKSGDFP
jgi:hypothetical protein